MDISVNVQVFGEVGVGVGPGLVQHFPEMQRHEIGERG